jgi:hypothetical protein
LINSGLIGFISDPNEEEKTYDANADGRLSLREKRKKATDDFKQ